MGIKELKKLLKEKIPDYLENIPLSKFRAKRIAIDISTWAYANYSIAWNIVVGQTDVLEGPPNENDVLMILFEKCLELVCKFLNHGVTPVFIFEGVAPPEKQKVKQKRKENKTKKQESVLDLNNELSLLKLDPLSMNPLQIAKLRDKYLNAGFIGGNDLQQLEEMLSAIGIPNFKARSDAEKLASFLCREGIVDAVYSTDTDNLVYGCSLWLIEFSGTKVLPIQNFKGEIEKRQVPVLQGVYLNKVLEGLHLSFSDFVDFCILAGCDYNEKLKGKTIIPIYDLFLKYGSAEETMNNHRNCNYLEVNLERCREIFRYSKSEEWFFDYKDPKLFPSTEKKERNFNLNSKKLVELGRAYLAQYRCSDYISKLHFLYQDCPTPIECEFEMPINIVLHSYIFPAEKKDVRLAAF